jgi:FkbM family methyltransferase
MISNKILKLLKDPVRIIRIVFFKVRLFYKWFYAHYILKDFAVIERTRWYREKGDEKLRLDYKLNKDSIVFDVGGYVGNFSSLIYEKYKCTVYIFEPSPVFYKICVERFKNNEKIFCFNYGLSNSENKFYLSNEKEASSITKNINNTNSETVKIRKFSKVFQELKINQIDLLKVNIEGSEYNLIPHIIEERLIEKINNIQIQFHIFISNAKSKRSAILKSLGKTHKEDWCYYFVWEGWSLK